MYGIRRARSGWSRVVAASVAPRWVPNSERGRPAPRAPETLRRSLRRVATSSASTSAFGFPVHHASGPLRPTPISTARDRALRPPQSLPHQRPGKACGRLRRERAQRLAPRVAGPVDLPFPPRLPPGIGEGSGSRSRPIGLRWPHPRSAGAGSQRTRPRLAGTPFLHPGVSRLRGVFVFPSGMLGGPLVCSAVLRPSAPPHAHADRPPNA